MTRNGRLSEKMSIKRERESLGASQSLFILATRARIRFCSNSESYFSKGMRPVLRVCMCTWRAPLEKKLRVPWSRKILSEVYLSELETSANLIYKLVCKPNILYRIPDAPGWKYCGFGLVPFDLSISAGQTYLTCWKSAKVIIIYLSSPRDQNMNVIKWNCGLGMTNRAHDRLG